MKNLEDKCVYKKWDISDVISKDGKTNIKFLEHLKQNPSYKCYFCDGYDYNCEEYTPSPQSL